MTRLRRLIRSVAAHGVEGKNSRETGVRKALARARLLSIQFGKTAARTVRERCRRLGVDEARIPDLTQEFEYQERIRDYKRREKLALQGHGFVIPKEA